MAMPIVREKDGLAMSSRNSYLSESERKDASVLHQSLLKAESMIRSGEKDSKKLIRTVESMIRQKPSARIDYIAVVNEKDFKDMDTITGNSLVALAVFIGKTRLIDNIIVRKA
jgi:pantoate--beta-alanine ligase